MTKDRKNRLKIKIQQSRERLIQTHPFFGLLLMYLKFVAVKDMKKISTNGRCIYFSPDFLDKLKDREVDFILCHQILHIIFGHLWLPNDRLGDDFHFACDIFINANLNKCGFLENQFSHLGRVYNSIGGYNKSVLEMSVEEIYNNLPYSLYMFDQKTRSKFLIDENTWWDENNTTDFNEEIIIDTKELDVLLKSAKGQRANSNADDLDSNGSSDILPSDAESKLKQFWQGTAKSVLQTMETYGETTGFDNMPESIERLVKIKEKHIIDWKKILNRFLQEEICDYSFAPPDRRFNDSDFFLPDFNEKDFITKDILFMVDTSGSIDDEDLSKVYSEIAGAIEQYSGKLKGKIGFFDAAVTPPVPFETVTDLKKIVPYGGGGTDFTVIFDYIRNNYKDVTPGCVVIFTDGKGCYPRLQETMGIPTMWILNDINSNPPFGIVAWLLDGLDNIIIKK